MAEQSLSQVALAHKNVLEKFEFSCDITCSRECDRGKREENYTSENIWNLGLHPPILASTDPAGITYHPSGHLFISDSEIDELSEIWN